MAGSEYERTIADIGERELIALLEPFLASTLSQNVIVGPGDDGAIVIMGFKQQRACGADLRYVGRGRALSRPFNCAVETHWQKSNDLPM